MDMDNYVVIAGERRELNGNGKNTIKIKLKNEAGVLCLVFFFIFPVISFYCTIGEKINSCVTTDSLESKQ